MFVAAYCIVQRGAAELFGSSGTPPCNSLAEILFVGRMTCDLASTEAKTTMVLSVLLVLNALHDVGKAKSIKYSKLKNSPIYKVDKILFYALLAQAYSDQGKKFNDRTFAKLSRGYRKAPSLARTSPMYRIVPKFTKTCDFTNDC